MNELDNLVYISRYVGQRFDMVQAGGGNTSVKLDSGEMLIKKSGISLADVSKDNGFVALNVSKVRSFLVELKMNVVVKKKERELLAQQRLLDCILSPGGVPSIECFMHALLKKYVVHIHPIVVGMLVCRKGWLLIMEKLFPDAMCIAYKAPGIDLALAIMNEFEQKQKATGENCNIIFLQNHGLVVHGESSDELLTISERVLTKIELFLKVNFDYYKLSTQISLLYKKYGYDGFVYVSQDVWLSVMLKTNRKLFMQRPHFPDAVVYCGAEPVILDDVQDGVPFSNYIRNYKSVPRVIIYKEKTIAFWGLSMKKAVESEAVFKSQIMIVNQLHGDGQPLQEEELVYLMNMQSEQYRQKI